MSKILKRTTQYKTRLAEVGRQRCSKALERKLVRDVSKDPRTTAKTIVNDLAKSGIDVSEKTVTRALHRNGLRGCNQEELHFCKRHIEARLKYAKDNLEKDEEYWKRVLWSDETKLELFGHRDVAFVWRKKGEAYNPKNTVPTVQTWWWEYHAVGMQSVASGIWISCQGRRNHEERRI